MVARVADGAMGRVYEGRHFDTKERVAIKVLHPEVARDAVAVERFKREYETAREMQHPNIVRVIDFGKTGDGHNFMTMEYLEGEELGNILRRDGKLSHSRMIRAMCQTALGLDYAHSFGFIHRDLKPDNLFLTKDKGGETVRILDFGSVKLQMETGPKLTAFGTTLGSPYYMSPEQAMGKQDVDSRTDVFALAAITYECLSGKIAFEAGNVAQILMKIISQNPTPLAQLGLSLPPRIDDVIDKGLRKEKTRRYETASAFAKELCEAFGLEGNVEKWATVPESELEAALRVAAPPAAKAFGLSDPPPSGQASAQAMRVQTAGADEEVTVPKANNTMLIGVAVGSVVLVGVIIALVMR